MDKRQPKTKVKVVVRVRPQLKADASTCLRAEGTNIHIVNHRNKNENLQYEFCSVFNETSTQKAIFTECVEPLLTNAFQGQNVSVFAYGPTGAGKTHTMLGVLADPGIIPRTMKTLFTMISEEVQAAEDQQAPPPTTTVTFSYLEIYNEKVQDLLKPGSTDLPIREDAGHNIFVAGLTEKVIETFDDFKNSFSPASSNRTVAATKLNEYSSRSHSILMLKICRKVEGKMFRGKVYLIDLAGSEDNRRTGNQGIRMKESAAINKSLFVLGEVVDAINHNQIRIPYRNSKLTRLLQDSIGGSCHSVMITNIAPEQHYYYDTYCTLNFATKSKKIVNTNTISIKDNSTTAVRPMAQLQPTKRRSDSLDRHKAKRPRISTDVTAEVVPSPLLRRQEGFECAVNEKLAQMERLMQEMRDKEAVAAMAQITTDIKNAVSTKAAPKRQLAPSVSTPTLRSPKRRRTYRVESVSPSKRRRRSSLPMPVSVSKEPVPQRRRSELVVSVVKAPKPSTLSRHTSKISVAVGKKSSASIKNTKITKNTSAASKKPPVKSLDYSGSSALTSKAALLSTASLSSSSTPSPLSSLSSSSTSSSKAADAKPDVIDVLSQASTNHDTDRVSHDPSTPTNSSPNVICPTPQVGSRESVDLICPTPKESSAGLTDKTNLLYQRAFLGKGKKPKGKLGMKKNLMADEPSFSPLFFMDKTEKAKIPKTIKVSVADSPKTAKRKNAPYQFMNDEQLNQNMDFLATLNSASVKELQKLQKVGVKRAQLIFDYRTINGPIDFVKELEKIPGFTDKFIQGLLRANLVTNNDDDADDFDS